VSKNRKAFLATLGLNHISRGLPDPLHLSPQPCNEQPDRLAFRPNTASRPAYHQPPPCFTAMWAPPDNPFFLPPFLLPAYLVTAPRGREATQATAAPMAAALPRGHRRCAPHRSKSPSTVHPSTPEP
jgi:hypothetical protein